MQQIKFLFIQTGWFWLWITGLILLLDQATKLYADAYLELAQPVAILPFLNLTLLYNTGAAFSFMADAGGWQRWLFSGIAVLVSVFILTWMARLKRSQFWLGCALALILSGAIGNNLIDRLIYGHVIDFIDVYYQQWHWPVFNVADSAITVGAIMLLIDAVRGNN